MTKHIAIYVRVSTRKQNTESQEPDLTRWAASQDGSIKWYSDTASGTSMDRPSWSKLQDDIRVGKVSTVVVWRMDRLGRTVSGLSHLFDEFRQRRINFVSLKDGVDLSTPAGRLMANVLASVAAYETEVRGERIVAGQEASRAKAEAEGRTLNKGGANKGKRKKVTSTQIKMIRAMHAEKEPITSIAKAVKLSRPTIYDILSEV